MSEGKQTAIGDRVKCAADFGANTVIGCDPDDETLGKKSSMLMVASATAVTAEKI